MKPKSDWIKSARIMSIILSAGFTVTAIIGIFLRETNETAVFSDVAIILMAVSMFTVFMQILLSIAEDIKAIRQNTEKTNEDKII